MQSQDHHSGHALGAKHHRHPRVRVQTELLLHHRRKTVMTFAEVHRTRRHYHPHPSPCRKFKSVIDAGYRNLIAAGPT